MRYILKLTPYLIFYVVPVFILCLTGVDFIHQPTANRGILCVVCGFCMGFWLGKTGSFRKIFNMENEYEDLKDQVKRISEELRHDKEHMQQLLRKHNIQWNNEN